MIVAAVTSSSTTTTTTAAAATSISTTDVAGVRACRRMNPKLYMVGDSDRGDRECNEDYILTGVDSNSLPNANKGEANQDQRFLAVFDGHGGGEAARYACNNLWSVIKSTEGFDSDISMTVAKAIVTGFLRTHEDMKIIRATWKRTQDGHLSLSGTTVACAIVQSKYNRMFVCNVGDSMVVLGYTNPIFQSKVLAKVLTKQHKPDDYGERKRIESVGGRISKGRVVWNQKEVPLLNMTRSLGDFWSCTDDDKYVVAPVPDIYVHDFNFHTDKFVIIGSDGLFDIMKPQEVVEELYAFCATAENSTDVLELYKQGPRHLIQKVLEKCKQRNIKADNISVVIGYIDCI